MARNSPAVRQLLDALATRGVKTTPRKIETLRGLRLVPTPPRDRAPSDAEIAHYVAALDLTAQGRRTVGTATALALRGHPVDHSTIRADVLAFFEVDDHPGCPNDAEERQATHFEQAEHTAADQLLAQDPLSGYVRGIRRQGIAETGLASMTSNRSIANPEMFARIITAPTSEPSVAFQHGTDNPEEIERSLIIDDVLMSCGEKPAYPDLMATVTTGWLKRLLRERVGDETVSDPVVQQGFQQIINVTTELFAQIDITRMIETVRTAPLPELLAFARQVRTSPVLARVFEQPPSSRPGRAPFAVPVFTEQTTAAFSVLAAAFFTTLGHEYAVTILWALSPDTDPTTCPPLP